jgi:hypothetical protein
MLLTEKEDKLYRTPLRRRELLQHRQNLVVVRSRRDSRDHVGDGAVRADAESGAKRAVIPAAVQDRS